MVDLYPKVSKTSVFPSGRNRTEANLRTEMINTLDGEFPEVEKGRYFLLRAMRRDSNEDKIPCSCRDEGTNEPDRDIFCPICYGTGYLFDETYVKGYLTLVGMADRAFSFAQQVLPPGLMDAPGYIFFTRYSDEISDDDQLIEIQLDDEGEIVEPVVRIKIFNVVIAHPYRCDNGKIEFWKVFCHKADVKHLNPPSYG
jgi:hypothetical protein